MPKTKNTDSATTPRKVIFSFFSGVGFLDLGFETSGYEVVYANEIHRSFIEGYEHARKAMGLPLPKYGTHADDIRSLLDGPKKKFLTDAVRETRKNFDLVGFIGGPPCPDFSIGGKNRGREGDNGVLSQVYVDLILQQKPDFFLFENVKGLWSTKRHREFYDELKAKLAKAGYELTDSLINAIEYGAPQDRNRIILLGFKKGITRNTNFPWDIAKSYPLEILKDKNWPTKTPERKVDQIRLSSRLPKELTVGYWFYRNKVDKHPNAKAYFMPRAALAKFEQILEGDVSKKSYKRLHRFRYSPTAAYGNNEVHIHPVSPRRISAAEALAIQSLPKEFALPDTMTLSNKFKAIGNGVPFLAAKGVAESINSFLQR